MEITDVRLSLNSNEDKKMKAGGSVTFDECFVIHGIRVIEVNGKTFVTMPQTKRKDEFKDICHPITTKFRNYIATEVLKEYEKIKER